MERTAKIKRVYLDDLSYCGEPDVTLTIHMDNGQRIMLNMDEKQDDPGCFWIGSGRYDSDPATDGARFYWPDGAGMTLDEVMDMLSGCGCGITGVETYEGRSDDIDVSLVCGHTLSLTLPEEFSEAGRPESNGRSVYWENGMCLSMDDMLAMILRSDKSAASGAGVINAEGAVDASSSARVKSSDGAKDVAGVKGVADAKSPVNFEAVVTRRRTQVTAVLASCAAVVVVVLMAIQSFQKPSVDLDDLPVPKGVFPFGVVFPDIGDISVPAGAQDLQMSLSNLPGNDCIFVFEIVLADTGEVLFSSEQVGPGDEIRNVTLIRPLEKGEYRAVLNTRAYDVGSEVPFDELNAEFIITVT